MGFSIPVWLCLACSVLSLSVSLPLVSSTNNGLALTPQMGWNSWSATAPTCTSPNTRCIHTD